MSPDSRRLPVLDGVRGVAILLVLLFHFSGYGHGLPRSDLFIDRIYYRLAGAAWVGVDLFFVLSGFLITGVLYDAKDSRGYFRNFYVRRALRIFPLYYGALLLFLVLLPWLSPDHRGLQLLVSDAAWYWTYLSNVKIAMDGWPKFGALGHFWSLAVEEQFYLLWPVVVLGLAARQLRIFCLVSIVVALSVRLVLNAGDNTMAAFVLTAARLDALAVGAYLAVSARERGGLDRLRRMLRPAIALLGLSLLLIFVVRAGFSANDPVVSTLGHTILAMFFGALLVVALTSTQQHGVGRLLASRPLRFFGRYSYGLYVFHHPLLFFAPGLIPLGALPTIYGSQLARQFVFLIIAGSVSLTVAMLSWHLYENQLLKLKRFFPAAAAAGGEEMPVGFAGSTEKSDG